MAQSGFLIWITGLAGSGKTTLGRSVSKRLQTFSIPTVVLDGDELRAVAGGVFGYTLEERRKCAEFYSRLCKVLTDQNINVICCTISMFHSVRDLNRTSIPNYLEVYLQADQGLLHSRDQKQLYTRQEVAGEVMGRGMQMEAPQSPDLSFELGPDGLELERMTDQVVSNILKRGWSESHDQIQY